MRDATSAIEPRTPLETLSSRRRVVILSIVGALVLVALVAAAVLVLQPAPGGAAAVSAPTGSRSTGPTAPAPSPSTATPTASATPTPGATPEAYDPVAPFGPVARARLTSFELGGQVDCEAGSTVPETLEARWSSADAVAVYFAVGDEDASIGGVSLPLNGTHFDVPASVFTYPCGAASVTFVMTAVGADGSKESKREVAKNVGDVY